MPTTPAATQTAGLCIHCAIVCEGGPPMPLPTNVLGVLSAMSGALPAEEELGGAEGVLSIVCFCIRCYR